MRAEVEIKTELGHFEFNLGAPQIYRQVKLSKAIKPLNINLKQIIFDKGVLAKCCNVRLNMMFSNPVTKFICSCTSAENGEKR